MQGVMITIVLVIATRVLALGSINQCSFLTSQPVPPPAWSENAALPESPQAQHIARHYQTMQDIPWSSGGLYSGPTLPVDFTQPGALVIPPQVHEGGEIGQAESLPTAQSSHITQSLPPMPAVGVPGKPPPPPGMPAANSTSRQPTVPFSSASRLLIPPSAMVAPPETQMQMGTGKAVTPTVGGLKKKLAVYVGRVPTNISEASMITLLRMCGPVRKFEKFTDKQGRPKSFGFAEFLTERAVLRATKCLHDVDLEGSRLIVKCDMETTKLVEAHITYLQQQQKLFQAFPQLASVSASRERTRAGEEYPGEYEDKRTRVEILKMASRIGQIEEEQRKEVERKKQNEEDEKRTSEQRQKREEFLNKKLEEEKEKKQQAEIMKEMQRLDREKLRIDRKREKRARKESKFLTQVQEGEVAVQFKEGTRSLFEATANLSAIDDGKGESEQISSMSVSSDEELIEDPEKRKALKRRKIQRRRERLLKPLGKIADVPLPELRETVERQKEIPISRIRALLRQIPTSKALLFDYEIDWKIYENFKTRLEASISRWIGDKVKELLGQEERSMTDFIIDKLSNHTPAKVMYEELLPVLDEDTEVFILKLYRLVIFEVEKLKL